MQQEYFKRGCIDEIANIIEQYPCSRILLVTGKSSYTNSGAKAALDKLLQGVEVYRFSEFSPNPTFEQAMQGVEFLRNNQCDLIIAVGGGSAIDVAKAINAFQTRPGNEEALVKGKIKVGDELLPLIAIPTTAGTGSESTHFAVVYLNKAKYSLAANSLLPDAYLLDADLTDNLDPYITACTGFDALCQAVESYWAQGATDESRDYAARAIPLLIQYLPAASKVGDRISREKLLYAANLAGKAINISKTTAPHALSYGITSYTGIPHGNAVAITLGNFFVINEQAVESDAHPYLENATELFQLMGVKGAAEAREFWYKLMDECGLVMAIKNTESFKTLGVKHFVDLVNIERLSNHPVQLSSAALEKAF